MMRSRKKDEDQPLYMISVVCEMLNVHPQTLRMYEKEGFVSPQRQNRQRLYSDRDVERLNLVLQLTRELGVNRAGVDIILRMRHRMEVMRQEMDEMMKLFERDTRTRFMERLQKALEEDED